MESSDYAPVTEYGLRRILLVTAVMLAALLETLDSTIVTVALPTIEGNLGAAIDEGIWIVTGYIIANVVAIPLNPLLIRLLGRKRYFVGCIAGFTIASLLCSTAHTLDALVAFRVLQGAFGGGLIATSQVVMRETFPKDQIGVSSALFAVALILGPALGPWVGGFLTDNVSWQWIFDVNLLPGSVAAIVLALLLRDPLPPRRFAIDWMAIALLALGLGALQFVLDNGERREWFADRGIALAAVVALAALVSFVVRELRDRREPVVDLHVFRYRSVAVGALLGFAFGIVVFAPAIVTPLYGSSILTYTASESGLLLVARAIPVVLLTPIFATIAQRGFDVRYLLAAGFVLTAFALTWLQSAMTSSSPFAALAVPLFVSGIGQSMLLVPLIVGVLSTTPAELNGRVSPIITLAVQLGGSFASACVVTLFDRRLAFHADVLAGATASPHLAAIGFHVDGSSLAQLAALVQQEAGTLAYADTMAALALVALLVSPIVAAFPRSKATAA